MPGVKEVASTQVGEQCCRRQYPFTFWHAKTALDALPIVWDTVGNEKHNSATIARNSSRPASTAEQAFVGNQNGDVKAAIAGAAKKVEAVYSYPYQNHAPMEPMNATALYTADKCEVWTGTQDGESAFAAAVAASGLPADKCDVHKVMLGGGFGRRGRVDYVIQAVLIAKQMPGTPVKLLWTREEDMQHCFYHPITMAKMTGAFDKDNNLTGLHMRISGQSILATVPVAHGQGRPGPGHVPGPQPVRRDGVRLHRAEPPDRPRHAEPRTFRRASGAASTSTTTRSTSNASWTSLPIRSASTRWSSGAS